MNIKQLSMAIVLAGVAATTHAADVQVGVEAALRGTHETHVNVKGHGFVVKPAHKQRHGDELTVEGKLRHERWGRDDHITYTIVKIKDHVKDIDVKIQKGGILSSVPKPLEMALDKGAGYLTGGLASASDLEMLASKLEAARDGKWESAANFLIVKIAAAAR